MMKKRVLLLAVSCKNGGLCPGGLDLDKPSEWIRIVREDGSTDGIQGVEIDFAKPLDIIAFDGQPIPQGKQKENWTIFNFSCKCIKKHVIFGNTTDKAILDWAYNQYSYHGFWGNGNAFLNENEFYNITEPTESVMKVSNVRVYKYFDRTKIDFNWIDNNGNLITSHKISVTDQDYFSVKDAIQFDNAYIVISIPREPWLHPLTGERQAYKYVSKIFGISDGKIITEAPKPILKIPNLFDL